MLPLIWIQRQQSKPSPPFCRELWQKALVEVSTFLYHKCKFNCSALPPISPESLKSQTPLPTYPFFSSRTGLRGFGLIFCFGNCQPPHCEKSPCLYQESVSTAAVVFILRACSHSLSRFIIEAHLPNCQYPGVHFIDFRKSDQLSTTKNSNFHNLTSGVAPICVFE